MSDEIPGAAPRHASWAGLCLAVSLAVVATGFSNVFLVPFLWDDHQLVEEQAIGNPPSFAKAFSQPFFDWWGCYYRPLTTLSYVLDARLYGAEPAGFHATNLLLHLVNVALLFCFVRRLGLSSPGAALAAAAWGLMPRLSESVTGISGRTDVAATTCVLGALLLWDGERPMRILASVLMVVAGLFFKEVAMAAIPAIAVLEIARNRGVPGGMRRAGMRLAPFVAVLAGYGALRYTLLSAQYLVDGITAGKRILLAFQTLGTYAVLAVDAFRPRTFIGDKRQADFVLAALGAVVAAGIVGFFIMARRRARPAIISAVALSVAALLPVLHLVPLPVETVSRDPYAYLPLAGLTIAVAGALAGLAMPARQVVAACGVAFVIVSGVVTHRRNREWSDELGFWMETIRHTPSPPRLALTQLAGVFQRDRHWMEAARLYDRALRPLATKGQISAQDAQRLSALIAICLCEAGREDEGLALLRGLEKEQPDSPLLLRNVAMAEAMRLNLTGAREAAVRLVAVTGGAPDARALLKTIDGIGQDLVVLPADQALEAASAEVRRRRAAVLSRVGGSRAESAWRALVAAPDAREPDLREAAFWLLAQGSLESAAAAVARYEAAAPASPHGPSLRGELAERARREDRLSKAARELGVATPRTVRPRA